ncbi:unnamed protein product [Peniophora sp. CBMAI 1063]|nr:unnamed protein product [Peniophora sp. CBMAI 1063]
MFSRSIIAITAYVALASAAALDVFVPKITSPTAATVWKSGTVETVTWDTSNAPVNISNKGSIVLSDDGFPMDTLATGFDLRSGSQAVNVPKNLAGTNYTITLYGDSGNISPKFRIVS